MSRQNSAKGLLKGQDQICKSGNGKSSKLKFGLQDSAKIKSSVACHFVDHNVTLASLEHGSDVPCSYMDGFLLCQKV